VEVLVVVKSYLMKEEQFRNWLKTQESTIRSIVSRCKRIEKNGYDLNEEYKTDRGRKLIKLLTYSKNDSEPSHQIKFSKDVNLYTGTRSLKQAASSYFRFCEYLNRNIKVTDKIKNELNQIFGNKDLTKEEKKVLVKYRLGQSNFRKRLINYWNGCSVTNCNCFDLLIASHIKPWSKSTEMEKYDVFNGLLLTPNYDKLFDENYISFDEEGRIIISEKVSKDNLKKLGISKIAKLNKEKLLIEHIKYLRYHRKNLIK